jgi:hypothetical protein
MEINLLNLRNSINKAYLKVKPNRTQIETFKKNITNLFDQIKESESEEFHKNIISEFLKNTYYSPNNYINTKGRSDLVIHNGKDSKSTVGVLFEVKKPGNKSEMPTSKDINTKAFHELILYYLRERITNKNIEIKHLVITNIFEWFIFNANDFEKLFSSDKNLIKQFIDFEEGRLSGLSTDFFYKSIAEPFYYNLESTIPVTHFNISDFETTIKNANREDDNKLIALYKIFSPEHLLKLPFANDSNNLDKTFYNELLHIIGLEETKEGSKKLIGRKIEKKRNPGSLIENSIIILKYEDCLTQLPKLSDYGSNKDEQLFNIALELVITWINRILFLKLLEGQLIKYNYGDKAFRFLNIERIHDYDELNKLFFQVLAVKESDRSEVIKQKFGNVPYLNSSLFEPSDLEHKTIRINSLENHSKHPVLTGTVLKDKTGKKLTGEIDPLQYLFDFLDSYDFSSEGSEDIQEENKTLINASVLGLIFEKINGYKDGSFFTPGFITMYMCHETIRRAVVQKFNNVKGWQCETISDVYNKIENIKEADQIINSLRICDPAVGSGHFLVSALNEIIAIKSELKILSDREGKKLKEYTIEVINDELIITDEQSKLFEYNPKSKESQRIQEALFQEKQRIIENCLFGVDINPNSVKICRLRLWIELLKNAYYKPDSSNRELETLPNIDINIKCGNSLISRYPLDADIKTALKSSKWTVDNYREAVMTYRNAQSKDEKRGMEQLINKIKSDFETEVSKSDKRFLKLNKLKGELLSLTGQSSLFELAKIQKEEWNKKVKKLSEDIKKYESEIAEIKSNKIYENAFEWRFEFPEVLNNDGDFVGFDVVIGNPPYMRIQELKDFIDIYKLLFKSAQTGNYDLYIPFVEKSIDLINGKGILNFILPHKFIIADFGKGLRTLLHQRKLIERIIHFGHELVFQEATTYTCLLFITKQINSEIEYIEIKPDNLSQDQLFRKIKLDSLPEIEPWNLTDNKTSEIISKLQRNPFRLNHLLDSIFSGIQTSADKIYTIVGYEENGLVIGTNKLTLDEVKIEKGLLKPVIKGEDIKRYSSIKSDTFVLFPYHLTDGKALPMEEEFIKSKFPFGYNYFKSFEKELRNRENGKMDSNDKWFLYNYPKNLFISNQYKFVSPDITYGMNVTIEDGNYCLKNGAYGIVLKNEFQQYEYQILAILNSKLIWYYLQATGNVLRGGYFRFNTKYIMPFPIPNLLKIKDSELIGIVNKILEIKKSDSTTDTIALEAEIDQVIYKIYDLTEEEIQIIEK